MEKNTKEIPATKRDNFIARLGGKHEGKTFADDEALFGQAGEDYDDYERRLEEYRNREQTFSDMFSSDPRSAAFLQAWKNGDDPAIALIRRFGPELEEILHDESKQEAIAAANKEYAERVAKEKEYEEEYQNNLQASLENFTSVESGGASKEDVDAAFGLLLGIVRDGLVGKFSVESIEMAIKAIKHDADVADAGASGEVRGRNAKIDEKLRKSRRGDGTAPLGGKNGTAAADPRVAKDMGALGGYGDAYTSIWERGGEKRSKY